MSKVIKSYKALNQDFTCKGFQYEVGKEYECKEPIDICRVGFHACENPFDVWNHYDMLDSRYAEVEQSGDIQREETENSSKTCSSKIKIKAELKLADIINLGVEWLKEKTSIPTKDNSDIISDNKSSAQIGSSGDSAKIGSSGDSAKIGSSGYSAQIGSSGYSAQIGSSGDYAQIGSSGYSAKIGSSGDSAQIGSSGDYAQIGSSGDSAQIGSSGDYAQIGSSGDSAKIGSSGDSAKIDSTGEDSVICCAGQNSMAKAKIGSWITLSEWEYNRDKNRYVPICVKTEYVDGERIKADTWYKLIDGEFKEQ
jgi:hypothetical protein